MDCCGWLKVMFENFPAGLMDFHYSPARHYATMLTEAVNIGAMGQAREDQNIEVFVIIYYEFYSDTTIQYQGMDIP